MTFSMVFYFFSFLKEIETAGIPSSCPSSTMFVCCKVVFGLRKFGMKMFDVIYVTTIETVKPYLRLNLETNTNKKGYNEPICI